MLILKLKFGDSRCCNNTSDRLNFLSRIELPKVTQKSETRQVQENCTQYVSTCKSQSGTRPGVSVLCWHTAPVVNYGDLVQIGKKSNSVIRSRSVTGSNIGVISYQWRMSQYMVILHKFVQHSGEGNHILFDSLVQPAAVQHSGELDFIIIMSDKLKIQ